MRIFLLTIIFAIFIGSLIKFTILPEKNKFLKGLLLLFIIWLSLWIFQNFAAGLQTLYIIVLLSIASWIISKSSRISSLQRMADNLTKNMGIRCRVRRYTIKKL